MIHQAITRRGFLKISGAATASLALFWKSAISQAAPRPNVLLIHIDDLNDWVYHPADHPRGLTPNIDRLRTVGVSFLNAQAVVPVCGPSRKTLYSGWYPQRTNDWAFAPWRRVPALQNNVPLPLHFRNNGYAVYGAGKLIHEGAGGDFWTEYGIAPDYGPWPWTGKGPTANTPNPDVYAEWIKVLPREMHRDLNYGPLSSVPVWPPDPATGAPGTKGWFYESGKPCRYNTDDDRDPMPDEIVSAWAAELVRKRHDRPFFVAAGLIRPHSPLYAPKKYFDRFPLDSITLPPYLKGDLDDCALSLKNRWAWGFKKFEGLIKAGGVKAWKEWVQAYLACIAFADDQVGHILDALEAGPNRGNTIVVLTGDNGYHIGEKDCIQKWHLWEESTRIPLIVKLPGGAAGGMTCVQPVSHIDIYPTLVDLCGLPANPHEVPGGAALDGHSLRALLADPQHGKWSGPSVALSGISDSDNRGAHYSVRSKRYRYTRCANGEEELYDHDGDPNEWTNRAADPELAKVKADLRREMEEILKTTRQEGSQSLLPGPVRRRREVQKAPKQPRARIPKKSESKENAK